MSAHSRFKASGIAADDQAILDDLRRGRRDRAYLLRDETLSERYERLYDEEIDGMLRMRRRVHHLRRPDYRWLREWRDIGVRMHRPPADDA